MYYLRTNAAADAIKFTLDKTAMSHTFVAKTENAVAAPVAVAEPVAVSMVNEAQQTLPYSRPTETDYDQKRADMSCSLDNPDACEACGS
jgi:hypothetical protein